MAKNSDRWWNKLMRKNGDPTPETRRLVRKAFEASSEKALPPSEVERVPADLKQIPPKHIRHASGGHVHFYREHLLFGRSVVRKDPITRKFKRERLANRNDSYYKADGNLHSDGR